MNFQLISKFIFLLPIFSVAFINSKASAIEVSWTRINRVPTANKIAACPNGRIYVLHRNRSITVNRTRGRGSDWQTITPPRSRGSVINILCAGNKLHVVRGADIFRNEGTDESPRWRTIMSRGASSRFGFSLAATGASLGFFAARARTPAIFTLMPSTSGSSLWQYSARSARPWILKGKPIYARKIAAAGDQWTGLPRIFALNTDKSLWLNSGPGCERVGSAYFWRRIDRPHAAKEITAANVEKIYTLNTDNSLWEGKVNRTVTAVSLGQGELALINLLINSTTITLDRKSGTNNTELRIVPSRALRTAGLSENTEDLGEFKVPGPLGARLGVWFSNFRSSRNLQLRLIGNSLEITVPFQDGGRVTVNSAIRGNWDIKDAKFTLNFSIVNDSCGLPQLRLKRDSSRFDAELQGDLVGSFIGNFEDIRAKIEQEVEQEVDNYLEKPEVKAGLSKVLLDIVPLLPSSAFLTPRPDTRPWNTLISGTVSISRGYLLYRVER